ADQVEHLGHVHPHRFHARTALPVLLGQASTHIGDGAFGQVLDLVQVPPAHGGDLTGGGVDLSGDGGLEQLPDVTGAAGAAASAGVEPAHGGLGQVDHGQADFLGDLGLGGRLVAGVLIEGVSGDRGDPGRGGVALD